MVGMQNLVQTFDMVDNGTNQKQSCSQGTGSHVETIGFDSIGQHVCCPIESNPIVSTWEPVP